jgi:hypothetical protein
MKKYELTNETIEHCGRTLYRIKALRDFGNVKQGDLGGYVESENNLSHNGSAWVFDFARVFGDAWVSGNGRVYGNAWVYGNAMVRGNARVFGGAVVSGNSDVRGNAEVFDDARVYGDAWVSGNAIATKDVINLTGLRHNITITDNHIQIGCKQFTLEQALKLNARWKNTKEQYKEAKNIEHMRKVIVDLIKVRLGTKQ